MYRNKKMLEMVKPERVYAFPGGPGTAMMIELANKSGVKVTELMRPPADMPDDYASSNMRMRLIKDGPVRKWITVPASREVLR